MLVMATKSIRRRAPASASSEGSSSRRARPGASEQPFYRGEGYRINESVGYLMKLAVASLVRSVDRVLHDQDLTAVQVLPLMAISDGKVETAAELARLIGTDPGAATRLLDRLEAKELICRTRCPDDRRVVRLALTATGKRLADRLPFVMADVLNAHLAGFSRTEFEQLRGLLRRLIANGAAIDKATEA